MINQSLESDISREVYESAFRFLQYSENGHDGEKDRQAILLSLATKGLLPMKSK